LQHIAKEPPAANLSPFCPQALLTLQSVSGRGALKGFNSSFPPTHAKLLNGGQFSSCGGISIETAHYALDGVCAKKPRVVRLLGREILPDGALADQDTSHWARARALT
jgi:hypothetical protein